MVRAVFKGSYSTTDTNGNDPRPGPEGDAEAPDRRSLDALGGRIESARQRLSGPPRRPPGKYSHLSLAWRMVMELVLGVVIGALIGYALDQVFGTLPILLVILAGFGFAAGIKTMMRTSREVQRRRSAE